MHDRSQSQRACFTATRSFHVLTITLVAILATMLAPGESRAYHLKHIYSFCHDTYCTDGMRPNGIVRDAAGNLFGTAKFGGTIQNQCLIGCGVVFELKRNRQDEYRFIKLYDFCAKRKCVEGGEPSANLVIDTAGNLYGTTTISGASNAGTAFQLVPDGAGGWKANVLHSFCSAAGCADGGNPEAGVTYSGAESGALYDGQSPLYGTAPNGGANVTGVVYQLSQTGGTWSEQVLHDFCSQTGCADGARPISALRVDAAGNLYGATPFGGNVSNTGVVYRLSESGGSWGLTVLHTFCEEAVCKDGSSPQRGVALDAAGALYGTTFSGGTGCKDRGNGCGVLYRLADNGGDWAFSVLHNFCSSGKFCDDGSLPYAAPTIGANGDLYGTTDDGGNRTGRGIVYRISGGKFDRIKRFCGEGGRRGCDAGHVDSELLLDGAGHVFGAADVDGAHGEGIIFELSPTRNSARLPAANYLPEFGAAHSPSCSILAFAVSAEHRLG